MAPFIVDDEAKLQALLHLISKRTSGPEQEKQQQLIFVDLEGVDLGRSGQIAIMQLLMPPSPVVYLVDVHRLEEKAFNLAITADGTTTSLKSVLESPDIFKVFFDIRNDSDAMHALFGVNVAGIIDLQVIEFATRNPRGKFVNGLAKCIERGLDYDPPGWSDAKAKGRRLFAPEEGGRYSVFLERPMAEDIVKYCEQDVLLMPKLLVVYGRKLLQGVAAQLQGIVDERIRLSKTAEFNGKGPHMAEGPRLSPARMYRNMPMGRALELVCSPRLVDLCRLDSSSIDNLAGQFDAVQIKDEEPAETEQEISSLKTATATTLVAPDTEDTNSVADLSSIIGSNRQVLGSNYIDEDGDDDGDDDEAYGAYSDHGFHDDDDTSDLDYTACSADDCGYCGKCRY